MTARERSALLRMAGNIAGGIATRRFQEIGDQATQEQIARDSVTIALLIQGDPRLEITEGEA